MKRFNKSYQLSVILMLFVLVIDGIRGDKSNRIDAEQEPFETSNRIDAEQEPFETVTLADDGGARSTLFASCLATSRTLVAKFYSIEISDATNEFFRYVPDSSQLTVPPEWKTVARNPPVTTITDCAEAAHSGGNPMFKYSGGDDCKVCNRSYDLNYKSDCEAEEQPAVFISSSAVVKCPLPRRSMLASKESGTYFCVFVTNGPLSYSDAGDWCSENKGDMYPGPIGLAGFDDLVKILKDMKVESGNFAVAVSAISGGQWSWASVPGSIDPALMVSAPSTSATDMGFISGPAGFKLDFAPSATYLGGVVCIAAFTSP